MSRNKILIQRRERIYAFRIPRPHGTDKSVPYKGVGAIHESPEK